jgi:hypothetical protein
MKIVIIPGVGYQSDNKPIEHLGNRIKKDIDCTYEIFNWHHTPLNRCGYCSYKKANDDLAYSDLRDFVTEVILDFEFAVKYGGTISIPFADYYIGHSAGSLFAISQDKPCAMFGSPVALVKYMPKTTTENLFVNSILDNDKSVLNLVNRYDVVAYPMHEPEVKDVYFDGFCLNPMSYFPLTAHTGYWESSFVAKEIVKHIKSLSK